MPYAPHSFVPQWFYSNKPLQYTKMVNGPSYKRWKLPLPVMSTLYRLAGQVGTEAARLAGGEGQAHACGTMHGGRSVGAMRQCGAAISCVLLQANCSSVCLALMGSGAACGAALFPPRSSCRA